MAFDDNVRPADMQRVDVTRYREICYWVRELKCTPDQLRAAVKAAGTSPAAVRAHLEKR